MSFISFSFNDFLCPKFFLIYFLQFFFIKSSNNFFTIKIINNMCNGAVFLASLITKAFLDQFGVYPLAKTFLYFFYIITNFNFWIFIIEINIAFSIITRLNTNRFHFNCSMVCIAVYSFTISSNL